MKLTRLLALTLLFVSATALSANAQQKPRVAAAQTNSTPAHPVDASKEDTYEYIRGKILSLSSPNHDYSDVVSAGCRIQLFEDHARWSEINFGSLDAGAIAWTITPDKNVSFTLVATPDTNAIKESACARGCTVEQPERTSIFFSLSKASQIPDFQNRFSSAIVHFIELCGGRSQKNIF